ncbi:protein phosphatase 2A regulatory subunit cdc55 [Linnemannia elongata]|nr:protein phosphatase 2A regulatory subunit cdc55 [Linnemannia elongata]
MASETEHNWKFAQCFGDKGEVEDITEADIISTVEFDHTGDYLATGDKGGRVVLFERNEGKKGCEYRFHTEFQSHEPEFDYLKSLEIEEKINKIKWCKRQNSAHFLLSTNDKTVKLWKVFEKSIKVVAENNHGDGQHVPVAGAPLRLPKLTHHDTIVAAVPRKVYANAHAYHINSISINSDGETYISADDLRINLWNLNISDQSFNIVDIKPVNMEELTEVITAAEFHPVHCNLFMYSSSKGTIKLSDMRESALCDQHAKLFEEEEDPSNKSFFSEIISSISDVKFSKDGRYILSRDYLTLKVWDINMESRPVQTINIHDHLRNKLCDLYENDCIFDKFECTFSGDGNNVLTGSYNNNFYIYDRNGKNDVTLQADKSAFKAKRVGSAKNKMMARTKNGKKDDINVESIDFTKKILHASWHPNENSIAIAATNNLFIFTLYARFILMEIDSEDSFRATLRQGIQEQHYHDICEILYNPDTTHHYSVVIDIMALVDSGTDPRLWSDLAVSPHKVLPILDRILQDVQMEIIRLNDDDDLETQDLQRPNIYSYSNPSGGGFGRTTQSMGSSRGMNGEGGKKRPMYFKPKCSARVMGLPAAESRRRTVPTCVDVGTFLSITATVIRTGVVKMLENKKPVQCLMCKKTFDVLADVEQYNKVVMPTKCQAQGNIKPCNSYKFQMVEPPPGQLPEGCRDYQEIKIQEQTNKLTMGTIPGSMVVILHDDLVDHAKSGDDVTITGTVIRRWKNPIVGERCDIELALLANHVFIHNEQRVGIGITEEQRLDFEHFWEHARSKNVNKPFTARNQILSQICPKVYGLYIVKLAVMLVLTGGVAKNDDKSGLKVRGEPHLLLVGDPGTGKSQFLKYAAELNPRSVLTTGIGSSSAGLTVTAVRDGNEWQLEAGALVLADRGLCCIDEFGGMREHDKVAIHEAMEQQSISIAKAGIVCKLNTRCSVIAATNPKGKYDPNESVSINIALGSPLLSRFDIVLVLMDTGNPNWDQKISSYILDTRMRMDGQFVPKRKRLTGKEIRRRRKKLRKIAKRKRMEALGLQPGDDGYDSSISDDVNSVGGGSNAGQAEDDEEDDEEVEQEATPDPWSLEKVKAYLIWIKSTFQPKLTPPAEQVLVSYYQLQRKADLRNAARTTIRLLESLIRLSQAHARLMARNLVTVQDAVVVISLMEATAQGGAAVLGGINPLHASFPKSAEEEYWRQESAMLDRLGLANLASQLQEGGYVDDEGQGAGYGEDDVVPGTDIEEMSRPGVKRRRENSHGDDHDHHRNHYRTTSSPSKRGSLGGNIRNVGLVAARSTSSSASTVSTTALSTGSMVLDDQAEAEFLERLRQSDPVSDNNPNHNTMSRYSSGEGDGSLEEGFVGVKTEEEEAPLIDRRFALRQTQTQHSVGVVSPPVSRKENKGKGVVRNRAFKDGFDHDERSYS